MKVRTVATVAAMAMMGLAASGCGLDLLFGDGDGVGDISTGSNEVLGPEPLPYLSGGNDRDEPDTCGRSTLMTFVGQMVDIIPPALIPAGTRVYETGSPLTLDFRLDRIYIEYDLITRDVVQITCG